MAVEKIAIIGIGCRFPKADNPDSYWQLLINGIDAIEEVPKKRWDLDFFYDQTPATQGKMSTRWGGFLEKIDEFDADFFRISPRELERMDPQQRLLLEVTWEALENGGITQSQINGTQTGVFIGISNNDYGRMGAKDISSINAYSTTGAAFCVAANRLSYFLNLKGPSLAIDTACSSSLVAVHYACQSLLSRESDLCLAGGVNLILSPETTIAFSQAKMMAADGRCKSFDDRADGYVRGEGCGVIVLKRLCDALRDGDNIQAVIRSSAVNQDGQTVGITAPNGPAQQAVIRQALKKAEVEPAQISYVEAQGTGTAIGDLQEIKSLKSLLMQGRENSQPCWIGSVKTNIGHLESASAMAGLIKVVLSLQNRKIPPHLHLQKLNRYISLEGTPLEIPRKSQPWEIGNQPRLAGISCFGFGGTNAHAILEEAPIKDKRERKEQQPWQIFTLSAKKDSAWPQLVSLYLDYFKTHAGISVADVCFTAHTGRDHFSQRLAIVTPSMEQLQQQLVAVSSRKEMAGVYRGEVLAKRRAKIAFLFTGQGSQYLGMGQELYKTQPNFRYSIDRCAEILNAYLEKPLLEVLYPPEGQSSPLDETAYSLPALFAIEYALYQLWKSWGIEPRAVMGYSVGECVAACVAGVFSLEDGLKLIAQGGKLIQALPTNGKMISVLADEATVRKAIAPYKGRLAIAAHKGLENILISGETDAIESLRGELETKGIKTEDLIASHAFHSPLMKPILAEFREIAESISYAEPKIELVSNLTGKIAKAEIATADYWCRQLLQPVRFSEGCQELDRQGYQIFLEVGPKPVLLQLGRSCIPEEGRLWLPSLDREHSDGQQMLASLAQLYVKGVNVNWSGFHQNYHGEKIELPTYPFQRQRYWLETENYFQTKPLRSREQFVHPLLGEKLSLAGADKQHRFQGEISASFPAYLSHYRIFQQAILPATAYLEIALAAGFNLCNTSSLLLEDIVLQRGLILPEDDFKIIQTVITPLEKEAYQFQIFSQQDRENQDEPTWILHSSGKIRISTADPSPNPTRDLEKYRKECDQSIEITDYYHKYKQREINYGVSFQSIQQLWKGAKQAVGKIELPPGLEQHQKDYQFHPALLDGVFQIVGAAIDQTDSDQIYLPVKIKNLRLYSRPPKAVWAIASIKREPLESEIVVVDEQGTLIAQIEGLRLMATTAQALIQSLSPIGSASESLNRPDFLEELQKLPISDRHSLLLSYLSKKVARVLGLSNSELDVEKSLTELGMDSLMASEIRNEIMSQLNIELPFEKFTEGYTTTKIANLILEKLIVADLVSESTNVDDLNEEEMEEIIL